MRRFNTLSIATAVALGVTGMGTSMAYAAPSQGAGTQVAQSSTDHAEAKKIVDRILKRLPTDWQARRDAAFKRAGIERSPLQQMAMTKIDRAGKAALGGKKAAAIDPGDYDCGPTRFDSYVDSILKDVDPFTVLYLSLTGALDLPAYDALLFGKPGDAGYALPSHATALKTTFNYSKRFWDVPLNNVKMLGMDTNVFDDLNKMTRTIQWMYDTGPADATAIATDMQALINSDPALDGGTNPLFTLNAFAFTGEGDPDPVVRKAGDKVVIGEGMLKGLEATGNGNVGPKAVLSHEMAHHVQYENDTFGDGPDTPEGTRRTELMADAFGSYFGAHKKGLGANPQQLLKFQAAFYDVGDCSFDSSGHHGTPNQRRASSAWGVATVAYANNPARVIPSKQLQNKFDKVLPEIVAPDAPTAVSAYRDKIAS